jgi:regulator of replication initiation timing
LLTAGVFSGAKLKSEFCEGFAREGMSPIGVEDVGREVLCPKCGKTGRVAVHVAYAKGFKYTYLVVEHEERYKDRKTKKKHVLKLIGKEKVLRKEEAKPKPVEVFAALPEYERLREENARLREENERLRRENEQLRMALQSVYNARIAEAREREREALRLKFIAKKGGLSPEVSRVAVEIMHRLVSEDWVAVRLAVLEGAVRW